MMDPNRWYALQLRHKCEHLAQMALKHKGYEVFLPTWRDERPGPNDRARPPVPLFPGYMFVRLEANFGAKVIATPSVIRFVAFGGVPAEVSPMELESVRKIVASPRPVYTWKCIPRGAKVRVESGPLKGAEGNLQGDEGKHHLVVTVTILNRSVGVLLDANTQLTRLDYPGVTLPYGRS